MTRSKSNKDSREPILKAKFDYIPGKGILVGEFDMEQYSLGIATVETRKMKKLTGYGFANEELDKDPITHEQIVRIYVSTLDDWLKYRG